MILQWLKNDFLGYLRDWEASVKSRQGFQSAERVKMVLSRQTREGLQITGMLNKFLSSAHLHACVCHDQFFFITVQSFVELCECLLGLPGVSYVLSEKFCQDPVESFLGEAEGFWGKKL